MIKELIQKNKLNKLRIAVLGDCMIDQYITGKVDRISPEFPVPILQSQDNGILECGGAANVCYQMKYLNVDCFLLGMIDEEARNLYQKHFNCYYSINLQQGKVPRKVRFYDDNFPLFRWDIESPQYGEKNLDDLRDKIISHLQEIENLDVVILSDYNKGFWSDWFAGKVISICNEKNIPTIVDPKKKPIQRWEGCTIFKPNYKEAIEFTGVTQIERQMQILSKMGSKIIITKAGEGFGVYNNNASIFESTKKVDVNSCIGAGDTFAAFLALCIGHKLSLQSSCGIAFNAGLEYVRHKHNKPITLAEVHSQINPIESKIVEPEDIKTDQKLIFTNGCFDFGLTSAHIECLQFAKMKGDKLVVALNTDESVKRLKGSERPVMTLEERMKVVAGLEMVDYVTYFEEDTPLNLIKKLKPYAVVKGGDYKKEEVVGYGLCDVFVCEKFEGLNTTEKINKISK